MPNNLLGRAIVPEYMQSQATVANLAPAMEKFLNGKQNTDDLMECFAEIHRDLKCDANENAAQAVLSLIISSNVVHP